MASTAFPPLVQQEPVTVFGPLRDTITIAARTLANTPSSSTQVLWSSQLSRAVRFSFDTPIGDLANRPATWQLAVMSEDEDGTVSRYVLVPPRTGEILWPRYEGQTLESNATLEIWSVSGQASAAVTQTVLTLGTYTRQGLDAILMNDGQTAGTNTTL